MATQEQIQLAITGCAPPEDLNPAEITIWKRAIKAAAAAAEIPFRGILYGANTAEEKFQRFVDLTVADKSWHINANHISGQTGWSRDEAKARLDKEVTAGRLAEKLVIVCGECGTTDDDEFAVEEFEAKEWTCTGGMSRCTEGYGQKATEYIGASFAPVPEPEEGEED